ncbi:DUF3016 domain-containing protein [Dokdonella immobilis]|uniref:DUF3016 domain-containing protein n=1 Tax=Dokdonella immobilis TaxID=578942 RepID=A0A1I4WBE4_9GAMM|nr:DUF3016 domain-containing protein [Dokdonella immobilis]SFN10745.1 Protein of unknown function [Dokdonella immobilis]
MNRISPWRRCCVALALLGLALASAATVAAEVSDASRVSVNWTDPAQFTEVRYSHALGQPKPETWLESMRKTVVQRADKLLKPGQHLEVTLTDVKLAGQYEPWRGPAYRDVRVVRDMYPPRIDLRFSLTDANGSVIASGERKLRDPGFLTRGTPNGSDSYRFENRLLKDWLVREFGADDSAARN